MTTLSIVFVVGGAPKTATTSAKLRDSTGTYAVKNNATGATVIAPTSALTPIAVGTYEYDVGSLAVGSYTAVWEFIDAIAGTVYVPSVFAIDAATAVPQGVSLMDIEQHLARLTGPYWREPVTDALATVSAATLGRLKTRADRSEYQDLYVLRRGLLNTGAAVQGFNEDDRVRSVYTFTASAGTIQVDRDWTTAPVQNEMLELVHMHPDELRYAVQEGLKRCFFLDLITVSTSTAAAQRDLAAAIPWLADPSWIYGAEWNYTGSTTTLPGTIEWWTVHREGMSYQFRATDPYPNTLALKVARPYSTLVNGVTSLSGPDDDSDIVPGPVEYCAKAGHVECWRYFPDRMLAAAEEGYRIGRKEAVDSFEAASYDVFRTFPSRGLKPPDPYGWLSALREVRVN